MPIRSLFWPILLTALLSAPALPAAAQPTVRYLDHNVELRLDAGGGLHVTIEQRIEFDGEFSVAFLHVPLAYSSQIEHLQVRERLDDSRLVPLTFTATPNADNLLLEWAFEPSAAGDTRTFRVDYDVVGGFWVYPDGDFLSWDAVSADRGGVIVESSRVTVTLPPGIDAAQTTYRSSGPPAEASGTGSRIHFRTKEPVGDGEAFSVAVSLPHGLIHAHAQDWQKSIDGETLSAAVERLEVDLTLLADGRLAVAEQMLVRVDNSVLYDWRRSVPLLYVDGIDGVRVAQEGETLESAVGCEGCFVVTVDDRSPGWIHYDPALQQIVLDEARSGAAHIDWWFSGIGAGRSARFETSYTAEGVLRVGPDDQVLTWDVVPDLAVPVEYASLRLHLPPGIEPSAVRIESAAAPLAPEPQPDGSLRVELGGSETAHLRRQVVVTLPAEATAAQPARWQTEMETAAQEAAAGSDRQSAWVGGIVGALAALAVAGSALLLKRQGR